MGKNFRKNTPAWFKPCNYKSLKDFTKADWLEQLILRFFIQEECAFIDKIKQYSSQIKSFCAKIIAYSTGEIAEKNLNEIFNCFIRVTRNKDVFEKYGYNFDNTALKPFFESWRDLNNCEEAVVDYSEEWLKKKHHKAVSGSLTNSIIKAELMKIKKELKQERAVNYNIKSENIDLLEAKIKILTTLLKDRDYKRCMSKILNYKKRENETNLSFDEKASKSWRKLFKEFVRTPGRIGKIRQILSKLERLTDFKNNFTHPVQERCKELIKSNGLVSFSDILDFTYVESAYFPILRLYPEQLKRLFPMTYQLFYLYKRHYGLEAINSNVVRGISGLEVDFVDKHLRKIEDKMLTPEQLYNKYMKEENKVVTTEFNYDSFLVEYSLHCDSTHEDFIRESLEPLITSDSRLIVSINLLANMTTITESIENMIARIKKSDNYLGKEYSGKLPMNKTFYKSNILQSYDLKKLASEKLSDSDVASIAAEKPETRISQTVKNHIESIQDFDNLIHLIKNEKVCF